MQQQQQQPPLNSQLPPLEAEPQDLEGAVELERPQALDQVRAFDSGPLLGKPRGPCAGSTSTSSDGGGGSSGSRGSTSTSSDGGGGSSGSSGSSSCVGGGGGAGEGLQPQQEWGQRRQRVGGRPAPLYEAGRHEVQEQLPCPPCISYSSDSEGLVKPEGAGWWGWLSGLAGCLGSKSKSRQGQGRTTPHPRLSPPPSAAALPCSSSSSSPCITHTPNPLTTSAFPLALATPGAGPAQHASARPLGHTHALRGAQEQPQQQQQAFHLSATTVAHVCDGPLGAGGTQEAKSLSLRRSRRVRPVLS